MGKAGGILVLIMLFMAVTSTGSAEQIAVSSLFAYDVYRAYINKKATGSDVRLLFWISASVMLTTAHNVTRDYRRK
jgi:Na+/proline symporter